MKKTKRIVLVVLLLTFLSGLYSSQSKFTRSMISFSTDIFKKIACTSEQNIFISPVSIYMALAMAYNGAEGRTKKAIEECLKITNISRQELNQFGKQFIGFLKALKDSVKINIANSIWIKNNYSVLNAFIKNNQTSFDAVIKRISMSSGDISRINRWISARTNNRIQDVINNIDPFTRMLLINAIYFLGNWQNKFDTGATRERDFSLANGKKIKVKTMTMYDDFPYYETEDFQAVRLDYKNNKLGLVVILPKEGKKLTNLLKDLDPDKYETIINNLSNQKGAVYLPRFKFKYSVRLNSILTDMGMGIAFTSKADFRGVNPMGGLFINLVQHDSFIEVNETGTEAAASTVIAIGEGRINSRTRPFVFKADRPFCYFIVDNERKTPFFMGTLYKP